jgi:uncharacterized repeat protein (TIGR01451 family)
MKMRAAALILFVLALAGCGSGSDSYDINTIGEGQSEPVPSGGVASFTMTVNNAGPDDAGTVVIENQLGRGLSLLDMNCAATGGAYCPGSLGERMSVDAMPAGATLVFTVRATTAPGLNGTTSNTMLARSTVASEDPNQDNDLGVAAVLVYSANLALNYTVPETVAAGTDAVFVATVTNGGPADARNVVLTHTPPAGLASGSITCQATDNAVCPGLTGDTMTVPLLPVGSSLRFQIPVPIALDTRGPVSGQFTVDSAGDPVADNNRGSATTTVVAPSATVVVAHTVPATVIGGTPAVFTATVSNRGPNDARDVALTFTLPAGTSLGSITCTDNNNGASCPVTPGLLSTVPLLPVGTSVRLLVSVPTNSTQRGDLTAVFQATAEGDATSDDNQRSATTTVRAGSADLAVSHSVPLNVNGGTTALFTATVDNNGPEDARDITLAHKLPVGYTGSFVCTAAGGAVCPAVLGATMTLPLMKSGGALRLQVSVPVALATRGPITAEFSASTDGDPLAENNSRSVTTTAVAPPANLSVNNKVPVTVTAGTDAVFTATVYNGGPDPSRNVVLVFTATGGSVNAGAIRCLSSDTALTCPTLGTSMSVPVLAVGQWLGFTFPVPVALGSLGTVSAEFKATADGDPSNTNNTANASTVAVVAAADLQVAHTVPATTELGSTAEFVATVTNFSQRDASSVTLNYAVTSPYAPGPIVCEATGGAICPTTGATMDVPLLPARGSLRFRVPVAASQAGTIQASFTASFAGDPDTDNNQAATLTAVAAPAVARSGAQNIGRSPRASARSNAR